MAASNARRLAAFLFIAFFANGTLSCAQELEPATLATTALLQQMTQSAGVVFAGEVISVQRPVGYAGSGQDAAEGVVTVEFRVHAAVRGCTGGSTYTLREWAGLWTGVDRYHAGQWLLLFLHSPDGSGLSSPVYGAAGVVPLRGGGVAPGPYDASAIAADWLVDLRWLQARALRATKAVESLSLPRSNRPTPLTRLGEPNQPIVAQNAEPELVPINGQPTHWTALPPASERSTQPLAQVLSLCREWVSAQASAERTGPDGVQ